MKLLVTGGYFDASGDCFVDRVDLDRGTRERLLTFVPPEPHRRPEKGFTGAAWLDDDTLLVCGFDAVWRFEPSTGRCAGRLHQPDFNDLHDVAIDPSAALIYVCNTGLDAVEIFDLSGRFVARTATSPAWFEAARQGGAAVAREDYERVLVAGWQATDRPALVAPMGPYYLGAADEPFHRRKVRDYAHPNHVVRWCHHLVVTQLASRDLRCLRCHRSLARLAAPPHDGVPVGDELWVTTVDGRVWRVAPDGESSLVVDVAATGHLGWCRGLAVSDDAIVVGLTALHAAPRYAWRPEPREHTETSVLWLDRTTGQLRGRVPYDEPGRAAKLFALVPARGGLGVSDAFVLMYHRVCERGAETRCWFQRGTAVTPEALDRQLTWLCERFDIVPLEALHEPVRDGDRARVALTFDDGYADTLEIAVPICARHRINATCFASAGPAFGGPPLWFDAWYALVHAGIDHPDWMRALAALGLPPALEISECVLGATKRCLASLAIRDRRETLARLAHAIAIPFPGSLQLDLDGLRRLRTLGWRVGGHGVDHVCLADADAATIHDELDGARRLLAELGEAAPRLFAYPDGSWSASVVEAAAHAGFAIACTTERGPWRADDDPLAVPRWFCRGDDAVPHAGGLGVVLNSVYDQTQR